MRAAGFGECFDVGNRQPARRVGAFQYYFIYGHRLAHRAVRSRGAARPQSAPSGRSWAEWTQEKAVTPI